MNEKRNTWKHITINSKNGVIETYLVVALFVANRDDTIKSPMYAHHHTNPNSFDNII